MEDQQIVQLLNQDEDAFLCAAIFRGVRESNCTDIWPDRGKYQENSVPHP